MLFIIIAIVIALSLGLFFNPVFTKALLKWLGQGAIATKNEAKKLKVEIAKNQLETETNTVQSNLDALNDSLGNTTEWRETSHKELRLSIKELAEAKKAEKAREAK